MTGLDERDLVELAIQLVDIPSPTGEEKPVVDWLDGFLRRIGFEVRRFPVAPDRDNLLALGPQEPAVLFCTHLDTVPPWIKADERDGLLYGRGSCDAKGIAASMIMAAVRLLQSGEGRVGLLFVVGEETDSIGAKAFAATGFQCPYVVVGEPTENQLVSGQKGVLFFRLTATGLPGHSADPTAGPSAVHRLVRVMGRLESRDWPGSAEFGPTTLNIGRIEGGSAPNVVADEAMAHGVFRVATSTGEVWRQLESCLEPGVEAISPTQSEPIALDVVPGFPTCTVSFGSDCPHLRPVGRILMAGPGTIRLAHRPEEHVGVAELVAAVDMYQELATRLIARV